MDRSKWSLGTSLLLPLDSFHFFQRIFPLNFSFKGKHPVFCEGRLRPISITPPFQGIPDGALVEIKKPTGIFGVEGGRGFKCYLWCYALLCGNRMPVSAWTTTNRLFSPKWWIRRLKAERTGLINFFFFLLFVCGSGLSQEWSQK